MMLFYTAFVVTALATATAVNPASSSRKLSISNEYEPHSKINSKEVIRDGPPYYGTIFVEPEIINSDDPTSYIGKTYTGTGMRQMYDRRKGWIYVLAYLFEVTYEKGVKVEFSVHKEFGNENNAAQPVDKYAPDVGKIPMVMLEKISQVWLMKGNNPWGGGRNSDGSGHILIHTGQGDQYASGGIVEETLMHEAAHASLDGMLYGDAWYAAAEKDNNYISTYAEDYPNREDIAETILMYFAVEYTKKRLSNVDRGKTVNAIPNRIKYLNSLNLDMYPFKKARTTQAPTKADTTPEPTESPGEDKCDGLEKKPCRKVKEGGVKVCIYSAKRKINGKCKSKAKFADPCEYTTNIKCNDGSDACKWKNNTCKHVCEDLNQSRCKNRRIDGKKACRLSKVANPCYGCNLKSECKN